MYEPASATPLAPRSAFPHVLIVSNHWSLIPESPSAGIFVDRQSATLKILGIQITTFDIGLTHSPLRLFERWWKLRRMIRSHRPDIVHAQYGTIVGLITALSGAPSVITFCGADLLPAATVSSVRRHLGFLMSNVGAFLARKVICKSDELRNALWWKREKAVVIPSGVDLQLFSPGCQTIARRMLGWHHTDPVAIFNGRDPQLKGLHVVQEAMNVVRQQIPRAQLFIVCDVEPAKMPLYYRAADVLISASSAEGSPNMIKEALACNLPIVSTPVGDVPERLAGVYPSEVVPREPKRLGDAVIKILQSRQRSNGREIVASLGLKEVAIRVLDVYDSVLRPRFKFTIIDS